MPWVNDPESRRRSDATYSNPEYKRNRAIVARRAAGRCECDGRCGMHQPGMCRNRNRTQCDHIVNYAQSRSHAVANLRMICSGPGSCHAQKTATEGGGWRQPRTVNDPEPVQRTAW